MAVHASEFELQALLTDKGRACVLASFEPVPGQSVQDETDPEAYVIWDTKTLSLARANHCLAQCGHAWALSVSSKEGCETILDVDAIVACIERLAESLPLDAPPVASHAWAAGCQKLSAEEEAWHFAAVRPLLSKYALRPLAQLWTKRQSFFSGIPAATNLDLETVYFGSLCAEPAALANRLAKSSEESRAAPPCVTFAKLRSDQSGLATRKGHGALLQEFLTQHTLDEKSGGCRPGSSAFVEYLRTYRPRHFSWLAEAGIALPPRTLQSLDPMDQSSQDCISTFPSVVDGEVQMPNTIVDSCAQARWCDHDAEVTELAGLETMGGRRWIIRSQPEAGDPLIEERIVPELDPGDQSAGRRWIIQNQTGHHQLATTKGTSACSSAPSTLGRLPVACWQDYNGCVTSCEDG